MNSKKKQIWTKRFDELLDKFKEKRILVIGDVGIDRYTVGTVERVSPEAPVPIVFVTDEKHKMGLAANVADNIKVLDAHVDLVGVIGSDRYAQDFKAMLKKQNVSSESLVVDRARRTIVKERVVSDRQQLLRIDYETPHAVSAAVEKAIEKRVKELMPTCDAVILQDYAKGMVSVGLTHRIFALAKKLKKTIAVDPNAKSPVDLYVGGTFITPNLKEAEKLSGVSISDPKSLVVAGQKLLKLTKCKYVIITRGKDGMAVFSRDKKNPELIPTYAREVYDVSGAGDTVISVMALAYAAGATIKEAAILGNIGAGVVVGKRGTATVTQKEMRESVS